jgi:D-alanyl-lipoteichoic acid acyltransferase DltB (MBOAT superfamily)
VLFNSPEFLLIFLPLALSATFIAASFSSRAAIVVLAFASFAFYAWWDWRYLPLLAASIVGNFLFGRSLTATGSRPLLALAVALNLGLLGYYKYASFFIENVGALAGADWTIAAIVLPLGISFYTFHQIAFLVDARRGGAAPQSLADYALFVSFFPQLIAGPILRQRQIVEQYRAPDAFRLRFDRLAAGLMLFAIGLFKKAIVADQTALFATPVFDAAAAGGAPTLLEAWGGALAYAFQLYFDFSGYSDMAIGLGWMVGVMLPQNFNSPYLATGAADFWRRWHITLSHFLRDYLYLPLGGNRRGPYRRGLNVTIVMLLGGLWHGAGWTFVLWGALHGVYLLVNQLWRAVMGPARHDPASVWSARLLTFLAVVAAWVLFRAASLDAAGAIYAGMLGWNGFVLDEATMRDLGRVATLALSLGADYEPERQLLFFGGPQILWLASLMAAVWLLPNSMQIFAWRRSDVSERGAAREGTVWSLLALRACAAALLLVLALPRLFEPSEFLYFQF